MIKHETPSPPQTSQQSHPVNLDLCLGHWVDGIGNGQAEPHSDQDHGSPSRGLGTDLLHPGLYCSHYLGFAFHRFESDGGWIIWTWLGTVWTSFGAIIAAVVAFYFSRTIGRERVANRLAGRWQQMDTEVKRGGLFYMFAIRLVPIMPYGLVNFAAGLTSIRFHDFLIGTTLGTVPSVLPFVLLGSSSVQALNSGNIAPLIGALALTGVLVAGSTYWRQQRSQEKCP